LITTGNTKDASLVLWFPGNGFYFSLNPRGPNQIITKISELNDEDKKGVLQIYFSSHNIEFDDLI